MIARGRVIVASGGDRVELPRGDSSTARGRRIPAETVVASDTARQIVRRAEAEAARIVEQAQRDAAGARLRAEIEARAAGAAAVAASAVALATREAASVDRQRDRLVQLARALAERLLGEELHLRPEAIVAIAERILAEARGARQVRLVAHPEDAPHLEAELERLAGGTRAVEVVVEAGRRRGELRVESEIGTLDAELAPQLDRLVARLREALAP